VENSNCVEYSQFERQPAHTRGDERRSGDDRRGGLRREADRADRIREMAAFAVALCGGLAVLYAFFVLIGTIHVGQAVAATVVAAILAAIWLISFWRRMKSNASRVAQRSDRERRGF
jgi:protein-S-isoprenylcysteine O-methyltransferase Ste14